MVYRITQQSSEFLRNNLKAATEIEERVRLHFGLVPDAEPTAAAKVPEAAQAKDAETTAKEHVAGKTSGGGNGAIKRKARPQNRA